MVDPEALRIEVDTFMEAYDKKIAEVGLPQGSQVSPVQPRHSALCCSVGPVWGWWWQPGHFHKECSLLVLLAKT